MSLFSEDFYRLRSIFAIGRVQANAKRSRVYAGRHRFDFDGDRRHQLGLIGIFQFDLVAWLFGGQGAVLSRIIYTLVGIAAVWCISLLFRDNDLIEK